MKKYKYFHKTAKLREKINTPSYDQVTQPIYSSSINRYKNFDEIKNIKNDIRLLDKKIFLLKFFY